MLKKITQLEVLNKLHSLCLGLYKVIKAKIYNRYDVKKKLVWVRVPI